MAIHSVQKSLAVPGGYPLLPLGVGDEGQGYQGECDEADLEFHDWRTDRTTVRSKGSDGRTVMSRIEVASLSVIGFVFFREDAWANVYFA